jgi:hypothetical protein
VNFGKSSRRLNLLQYYPFQFHCSKARQKERCGKRSALELHGDSGLCLLEAVLFQSLDQFGVGYLRFFHFGLEEGTLKFSIIQELEPYEVLIGRDLLSEMKLIADFKTGEWSLSWSGEDKEPGQPSDAAGPDQTL